MAFLEVELSQLACTGHTSYPTYNDTTSGFDPTEAAWPRFGQQWDEEQEETKQELCWWFCRQRSATRDSSGWASPWKTVAEDVVCQMAPNSSQSFGILSWFPPFFRAMMSCLMQNEASSALSSSEAASSESSRPGRLPFLSSIRR